MKARAHFNSKGASRVSNQKVVFELKHRVVLALNKLADRDTYQIGVEELEKIIECLTPDGVSPFLSCILDTDSEQKSAVRKECIRLTGILATFHEEHIASHLGKIVASIVKRLKDPDSVVRDACVETTGVLASKLSVCEADSSGVFVALVKPLFDILGEQNKQLQSGSALCLARVIDNTNNPPASILQRMLTRTVRLLKNPHFMAKPAVIELSRSIIQAGGAPTQSALSAAITSIQDALKNSDWTTRKAASAALGEIASSGGSYYASFKSSCICSLESCRFDKVKPVRDTVLQALNLWRSMIGPHTPEPSETGSSIKENLCGGSYGDISSACESTSKNFKLKVANDTAKRWSPLSLRKAGQKNVEYSRHSRENDWQIEIAVPKTHNAYLADIHNEESEGSSATKAFERSSIDITSTQYTGYEYVTMDDKQECSSVSNLANDDFETKLVPVSHNGLVKNDLVKTIGTSQRSVDEELSTEEQRYFVKTQDRGSLDSTVTQSGSQTVNTCCIQTANEMVTIRKQLLEIENKQSDLLNVLKVFTTNTTETLSMIQLKVSGLEDVVDKMSQQLNHGGRPSDISTAKFLKKSSSIASPRLSMYTPRSSVDIHNRPPLLPKGNNEDWDEKSFGRSKLSGSTKQGFDMWTDPVVKESRNPVGRDIQKGFGQGAHCSQTRKTDAAFTTSARYICSEIKSSPWKLVKGHLLKGDLDSAYVEALHSGDEVVLIELLDKTGPVLETLSHKTANDVLGTLALYFLEQRFMNSMIPWLQQIVHLSTTHGPNYLALSAKTRREFLSAIQEAVNMEFSSSAERRSVTQLVMKLHQIWGKCS